MSIRELIDPSNSALIFIEAGKIFDVPVIYTSVETKSFSGYMGVDYAYTLVHGAPERKA